MSGLKWIARRALLQMDGLTAAAIERILTDEQLAEHGKRDEQRAATARPASITNSTKTRRDILDPAIEHAQGMCRDPKDTAQVWAQLQVLAQGEYAPLLAALPKGLKYTRNGRDASLTRDALDKRLHPEKRR